METFLKVLVLLVGILLVGIFVWEGLRRLKIWRLRKWGVKTPLQMTPVDAAAVSDDAEQESVSGDDHILTEERDPTQHVLNLYVESKSTGFLSYLLFGLFEKSGLTFNDELKVFEAKNELGEVDYYITSTVAPGVFNRENSMASIPAVSLFARPDLQSNPRLSFFKLLEGTHKIASELNGRVLNMHREVLTEESVSADYLSVVELYSVAVTPAEKPNLEDAVKTDDDSDGIAHKEHHVAS